ncbi:FG-GAP-like repeat-containing protein [Sediminibacterium ginsengisoli]|uniref:Gliding motility-associated C-terminal domain-containing protein n=1 Tax=Sediminibacterium ginsengisoli TaxID=413434 RepID=A0A1T4R5B5_9BACT|nr:FG-GAP-like repeat-containing protein [Sediminibacterium ginsengisoli]SKA11026.1 gliding motility-associated C-terminal domain-containing protein [Sediminibacterium ginsengisoli]
MRYQTAYRYVLSIITLCFFSSTTSWSQWSTFASINTPDAIATGHQGNSPVAGYGSGGIQQWLSDGITVSEATDNKSGQPLYSPGLLSAVPVISSFTPVSGAVGSVVTISGTGFDAVTANNIVYFGTVKATVTSATTTSLTVTVPTGAMLAPLSVLNTTNNLQGQSMLSFIVTNPIGKDLGNKDLPMPEKFVMSGQVSRMLSVDIDGDGRNDILTTGFGSEFSVFRNTATAGSVSSSSFGVRQDITVSGAILHKITAGDIDGDGKPDIVISDMINQKVHIFRNTSSSGSISFSTSVELPMDYPSPVVLADIDGDGKLDIVVSDGIMSAKITVFRNLATPGSITVSSFDAGVTFFPPDVVNDMVAGDIDGDGKQDLLMCAYSGRLHIFRNTATSGVINNGTFAPVVSLPITTGTGADCAKLADIDGDGKLDLLAVTYDGPGTMNIYRNNSTPGSITTSSFDALAAFPVADYVVDVQIGDITGDGKPEIAVASPSNAVIQILQNTSVTGTIDAGSFSKSTIFNSSNGISNPYCLALTDIDGDGLMDVTAGLHFGTWYMGVFRYNPLLAPSTSATAINFTGNTGTQVTVNWTKGNGQQRMVLVNKNASASAPLPVDGTLYSAGAVLGQGSVIGTDNWSVVYIGAGNSVTVSNLEVGKSYKVAVLEFNDNGYNGASVFNSNAATGNPVTLIMPATLNTISRVSDENTNAAVVDFDLVFNKQITGLTAANLGVITTGTVSGASVGTISPTGASDVYRVSVNTGTGNGTIALQLADTTGINLPLTNALPFTGEYYTIDKDAPVLTNTSISSNNAVNSAYATLGNVITLQVAKPADAVSATALINGIAVTPTLSGGMYLAALTVSSAMPDGIVNFSMTVRDAAGNTATTNAVTTGTPVTIDQTDPGLTGIVISSNNSNTAAAKPGDRITVQFTANEPLSSATAIIMGTAATVTQVSPTVWTASYIPTTAAAEGVVSFSVAYRDLAGNNGTAATATSDGSTVTFRKTTPVATAVTIASNYTDATLAAAGDVVKITFTMNAPIVTPVATIAGHTVTPVKISSLVWEASVTMTGSEPSGPVAFNISNIIDPAGNTGANINTTTNFTSVRFDNTAPALVFIGISSDNTIGTLSKPGDVVTISFSANQTLRAPVATIATHAVTLVNTTPTSWTAAYTMTAADTEGNIPFTISYTDFAGNTVNTVTATSNNTSVLFDKTPPVLDPLTITSNHTNPGHLKPGNLAVVRFTADEPIRTPAVVIAGNTASPTVTGTNRWQAVYTARNTDQEGIVPFSVVVSDMAGNTASFTAATDQQDLVLDKTVPVINNASISSGNTVSNRAKSGDIITLTFTSSEAVEIPVVTFGGRAATVVSTGVNNWKATYTMSGVDLNGTISFAINAVDLAGNAAAAVTTTSDNSMVVYDRSPLVISNSNIRSNNSIRTDRAKPGDLITLRFATNKTGPAPAVTIATHIAAVVNTGGNNWEATYTVTTSDQEGVIPFSISASDLSGNTAAQTSASDNSIVLMDKTIPVVTNISLTSDHSLADKAKAGNMVTLAFTTSEPVTTSAISIATHSVTATSVGGSSYSWQATYVMTSADAEGNIPFSLRVTDFSGNESVIATATTNTSKVIFDKTAPVLNSIKRQVPLAANVSSGPVTFRASFNEPVTGVLRTAFTVTSTGTANAAIDAVLMINDSTYDIRLINLTGNGSIRIDLLTFANVTDSSGNRLTAAFTNGDSYTVTTNSAPVFDAGTTTGFALCQNAGAFNLSSLLKATDADNGQLLTWTVTGSPAHGTTGGFPATANSNGGSVLPQNVTYSPAAGYKGTDQFTISVSDGTATASIVVNVIVNQLPAVAISAAQGTALCGSNAALPLTITSGTGFAWMRNGTSVGGNTSSLVVNTAGSYTALVTDANGCTAPASNSIVVTMVQPPKAAFGFTGYCVNMPVVITNQSTAPGTIAYQWSDGNGGSSASALPSFTYPQAGSYQLKLKITSSDCPAQPDSLTQVIRIESPAAAIRMNTINTQVSQPVNLQARSFGLAYQWSPATDLSSAVIANPVLTPKTERQYTVKITSAAGCVTVDTLLVKVFENNVYVPRVFTPNGDGQNDVLYFNFVNIARLEYVRVFNRYGKQVFETRNMNEGWDGRLNGTLQPLESYVWVIKATDTNGKPVVRQGTVTLLR